MDRTCGGCTVCCIVPPVRSPDFSKQSNTTCRHCTASGCEIYAARPDVCRDFACGWLSLPFLDDRWRPDRCGLLVVPEEENVPPGFKRRQGLNFTAFRAGEDLEQSFVIEMIAGLVHSRVAVFLCVPGPPGFHPAMMLLNPRLLQAAAMRDGDKVSSALSSAYRSLKQGAFEPVVL